jgi:hypothetical protein
MSNHHRVLKVALLGLILSLAVACGTVTPGPGREIPTLPRPLLGDVTLVGLVFDGIREAGRSTHLSTGRGSVYSVAGSGANQVTATGTLNTTQVSTTTQMERYDDDSIQVALRYALEEKRVVRRFVPDGRLRIEGRRVSGGASTGAGQMLWNVVNGVTLLGLLPGLPFLGSQEAEVELRVYYDDELIRAYRGHGDASWRKNMWGIAIVLNQYRTATLNAASAVAARNAVVALIEDPPQLPASGSSL